MPEELEETLEDPKSEAERKIQESLEDLKTRVSETRDLTKILADPAIQAVLDARGRGIEVSVVPKTEKEPEEEPEPDFDEMDNKALSLYITKKIFHAVPKALRAAMEPVMLEMESLKGYVTSQEDAQVSTQVETARKKYTDFNDYRSDMVSLSKINRDLNVEELYLIAKRRKGASLSVNPASEKPTGAAARARSTKPEVMKPGRAGFDEKLRAVLEGLDFKE